LRGIARGQGDPRLAHSSGVSLNPIRLGKRNIGESEAVYVIAEAGSNHNGSLAQAVELIEIAAQCGADAVKFQLFRANRLYPRTGGSSDYLKDSRSIYDIVREMEMPIDWIPRLSERAAEVGVDFLVTAFDERLADEIEPFVPAFKIASYEMTHEPLVRWISRKGKPIFVSTGTATLEEVGDALKTIRAAGNEKIVLLQCTAKYPAPLSSLNLRAMETLRQKFNVPVGLSDHSREPVVGPVAAVALGAVAIEKHFTVDNELPGPDHRFAVVPDELAAMVAAIRGATLAMGSGVKEPQPEESELREFARRSIFAVRSIAAGERLTPENVAVLRCGKIGYGLHPREYAAVLGRTASRTISTDELIRWEHLV
jgi:N-acetylneuraminate synthase